MSNIIKRSRLNLVAIPAIGLCFIGVLFLFEWINIGIIANPVIINKYYFGSEAMMAYGGWRYTSASLYAWTSFVQGMFLLVLGIFTVLAALQAKGRKTAIGWTIFFAWLIATWLSMYVA